MSISFRIWFLFTVVATSCFISVYCAAGIELLIESENESNYKKIAGNETGNLTFTREKSRDREGSARYFGNWFSWMGGKASDIVEDRIISGNPDNVRFYLYPNPENKDVVEEIVYGDITSLQRAHYRADQPWKIIIHGFTNSHISEPVQDIKNEYLKRMLYTRMAGGESQNVPGYNVIVVGWGQLADPKFSGNTQNLFYGFAVRNVPVVGKRVGEFAVFLKKSGAIRTFDQIHLLGFSLGSHVAGNAGNTIRQLTGEIPARITGLDPAGPSFYQGLRLASRQLSSEDAHFVDIIHTNQGALGIYKNIGHVDFYPNGGGPAQRPCVAKYGQSQNENALVVLNTCSHAKAPFFFSLTINRQFIACRCESVWQWKTTCPCDEKAIMGEFCDPRTRGSFYLDLNE